MEPRCIIRESQSQVRIQTLHSFYIPWWFCLFSNMNERIVFLGDQCSSSTLRISDVNDEELFWASIVSMKALATFKWCQGGRGLHGTLLISERQQQTRWKAQKDPKYNIFWHNMVMPNVKRNTQCMDHQAILLYKWSQKQRKSDEYSTSEKNSWNENFRARSSWCFLWIRKLLPAKFAN